MGTMEHYGRHLWTWTRKDWPAFTTVFWAGCCLTAVCPQTSLWKTHHNVMTGNNATASKASAFIQWQQTQEQRADLARCYRQIGWELLHLACRYHITEIMLEKAFSMCPSLPISLVISETSGLEKIRLHFPLRKKTRQRQPWLLLEA